MLKCGCEVGREGRKGRSLICSLAATGRLSSKFKYSPVIFDFQAVALHFRVDSARAGEHKKKKDPAVPPLGRFQELAVAAAIWLDG